MADINATFHESWHRVAELKPRLRTGIHVVRQIFRQRRWYVIQDQANNAFTRINASGYAFIGLLDGSRSVRQAWDICNQNLGDNAPTQGEVMQLIGQLATSNLLAGDAVPDATAMFGRFKRRRTRDIQGRLMNLLFPRIPIFDPDALLERILFAVAWIFRLPGLLLWLSLIAYAAYTIFSGGSTGSSMFAESAGLLRPDNWLLLFLAFILDKTVHESGHAIACKYFGRCAGTGGEIHVIGVMLLIFTPVPFVDASSAWLLPDKWRRAIVGAAGIWMELALAAMAAIVWRHSSPGSTTHAFCYNLMFIASVATLLFNGNPFLRYDGYYILADLLEIPNLLSRATQFASYLVRRHVFGVKQAIDPTESLGQRIWLLIYLGLSGIVRVLIYTGVILFLVSNLRHYPQLTLLLVIMATVAAATWLLVPVGRGAWYLLSSPELLHRRARALTASIIACGALLIAFGIVPLPHYTRVTGVVRTTGQRGVYAATSGFLRWYRPTNPRHGVVNSDTLLARLDNPVLQSRLIRARFRLTAAEFKRRKALASDRAMAQILSRQIHAIKSEISRLQAHVNNLNVRAEAGGVWISGDMRLRIGAYIHRGERIGTLAHLSRPMVLAPASQNSAGRIIRYGRRNIYLRVAGRPSPMIAAVLTSVYPAGGTSLPSPALSYLAGGPLAPSLHSRKPAKTAAPFFLLVMQPATGARLLPGMRIVARIRLRNQPLLTDLIHELRRTLQPGTGF